MARPGGFTNQYPPSSDGFIPNGQPPQFNGRPPVYPEKAPRPMMMGQHLPNVTNGNQQFSHPSSLSSQSSRDPSPTPPLTQLGILNRHTPNATPPQMSPVPPQQHNYNNVGSLPNLTNNQSSQNFPASQSGPHSGPFGQSILQPNRPIPTGITPPPGSIARPSPALGDPNRQQATSIPPTTNSASPYSATNSPQRFPTATMYGDQARQPNAGIFSQAHGQTNNGPGFPPGSNNLRGPSSNLGSSSSLQGDTNRGPNVAPMSHLSTSGNASLSLAGPPMVRTNASGTLPRAETAAQPSTNRMASYGQQASPSRQQVNGYQAPPSTNGPSTTGYQSQPTGIAQQPPTTGLGYQPQSSGTTLPPTRPSNGPLGPGMQNSHLGTSQSSPGLQRIAPSGPAMLQSGHGMPQSGPGMHQSGPGVLQSGPGMPQSGPGMHQSGPGMHQSGPGMHQSGSGMYQSGPGMPQSGPRMPQSGPGMPQSGSGMFQSGSGMAQGGSGLQRMPPTGPGMAQSGPGMPQSGPGMPLSGLGMPPSMGRPLPSGGPGMPTSGQGMPQMGQGMAPSGAGMPSSGPRMPPPGQGIPPPGQGMPPPGQGMPPLGQGMPPSGPGMPPGMSPQHLGTSSYQQNTVPSSQLASNRYPQQPLQSGYDAPSSMLPRPGPDVALSNQLAGLSVVQQGFTKLWGADSYDLLQCRNILPAEKVETPRIKLQQEFLDAVNCSPEIFRCTMTKIPETSALLQKSRLPLGILIHPFKDLNHLAVIQCQSIVRCRACRTYINPFVYFVDHKRWKCNLCFRVNELPEEFQFDPVSKTYGDPSRRPEIKSSTIEFIAPSEYMLRPPQPAVYLFLLDVSCLAVESGYLALFCSILLDELDKLPGDGRTQIGFITYDSAVHFYSLAEGLNQPQQMVVVDIEDVFLPCPDSLVVNLNESKELARDLLKDLPKRFSESHDSHSALGPALQAAYKLMSSTGGRVTVFQSCLPNHGPGALASREVPSARASKDVQHLNPATDFYKRLALDCSGQQIAVDLFIVNQQYCDLATLSGISQFSGGSIHHFPLFKATEWRKADSFEQAFRRYLTRKLGLEAVMRIRCSRGLAIHTFHGNFFVRSTDLLSLPNVNPDAGFAMQLSIEESLSDLQNICFQAALLYTSSKGERRIRVHTLCLPVAANLSDILLSADQQAIVGLLSKMAVDRSHLASLGDAREAFINVAVDVVAAYKIAQAQAGSSALLAPHSLRLLPMYILALLKYLAFRTGQSTRLDDRVYAMCQMKTLPLANLIQAIYPDMYPVHRIAEQPTIDVEGNLIPQPPRLQLTAEKLEASGVFLLDCNDEIILFIGRNVSPAFCLNVFGVNSFLEIREDLRDLPELETEESDGLRNFVSYLQTEKSSPATFQIIRDDSQDRVKFYERLIEDRSEASLSYYEFLQHIKTNVK